MTGPLSPRQAKCNPNKHHQHTKRVHRMWWRNTQIKWNPRGSIGTNHSCQTWVSIKKRKLIQNAPDIVFIDEEDQTLRTLNLETRLENANCDELAQRVVYRYHLLNASSERGWCKELIKLGITLRWIAQRRIWLEQKSKAPQTHQRQYMSH